MVRFSLTTPERHEVTTAESAWWMTLAAYLFLESCRLSDNLFVCVCVCVYASTYTQMHSNTHTYCAEKNSLKFIIKKPGQDSIAANILFHWCQSGNSSYE